MYRASGDQDAVQNPASAGASLIVSPDVRSIRWSENASASDVQTSPKTNNRSALTGSSAITLVRAYWRIVRSVAVSTRSSGPNPTSPTRIRVPPSAQLAPMPSPSRASIRCQSSDVGSMRYTPAEPATSSESPPGDQLIDPVSLKGKSSVATRGSHVGALATRTARPVSPARCVPVGAIVGGWSSPSNDEISVPSDARIETAGRKLPPVMCTSPPTTASTSCVGCASRRSGVARNVFNVEKMSDLLCRTGG